MITYSHRFIKFWLKWYEHSIIPVWAIEAWYEQFREEMEVEGVNGVNGV